MPTIPPPEILAALAIIIFLAIGMHEFSHCYFADLAGDPTPRAMGRVTLNLTKHFEPLGTLMIILSSMSGIGIGWGKASPINPSRMRNPRWDTFAAVAAGPISNLIQAMIYGMVLRALVITKAIPIGDVHAAVMHGHTTFLAALLTLGVMVNLALCIFNLIPLGPLDGHWLVGAMLPATVRGQWFMWNRRMGTFLLFGLILFSQLSSIPILSVIIGIPLYILFTLITGVPLI